MIDWRRVRRRVGRLRSLAERARRLGQIIYAAAMLGPILVLPVGWPAFAATGSAGDIVCSDGRRFATPVACMDPCLSSNRHLRGLAHLNAGDCSLDAQETVIKQAGDFFSQNYSAAVFGRNSIFPDPLTVLTAQIINNFYPPHTLEEFVPTFVPKLKDAWAKITQPGSNLEKPELTLSLELFRTRTPTFLISTVGHEMIHAEQDRRSTKGMYLLISTDFYNALNELEAESWQLGLDSFKRNYKINSRQLLPNMTKEEVDEVKHNFVCSQWWMVVSIQSMRTGPKGAEVLDELSSFMNENLWSKTVWLPGNPNWKTEAPGKDPGCLAIDKD